MQRICKPIVVEFSPVSILTLCHHFPRAQDQEFIIANKNSMNIAIQGIGSMYIRIGIHVKFTKVQVRRTLQQVINVINYLECHACFLL